MVASPLKRQELGDLADSVRRHLVAIREGEESSRSGGAVCRLEGALAGLEAALGRGDYLSGILEAGSGGPPNATDDMPSVIWLMCDYGVEVPLFPQQAFLEAMLPEALRLRMMAWQEGFEQGCHWDSGWRSEEERDRWVHEGTQLLPQVQEVFRGSAEVIFKQGRG